MGTQVLESELLAEYIDEVTGEIIYPSSDGKPMAETTEHFKHITTIEGNLDTLFAHKTDVFVAGDLLWYPEEGNPYICAAPDTMVVFGRPKGHRDSYQQWNEENIAPAVVFEILSKSNSFSEMMRKFIFYQKYGVQEYYIYDHIKNEFYGYSRENNKLGTILVMPTFTSPLLGITFEIHENSKLKIYNPDGTQFLTFVQQVQKREEAEEKAKISDENARISDEKARISDEKTRIANEETRIANEKTKELEKELQEETKAAEEKTKELEEETKAAEEKAQATQLQIEQIKKLLQEQGFDLSNMQL